VKIDPVSLSSQLFMSCVENFSVSDKRLPFRRYAEGIFIFEFLEMVHSFLSSYS
jgi:hypothetical protein